jgi:hypothetical protein
MNLMPDSLNFFVRAFSSTPSRETEQNAVSRGSERQKLYDSEHSDVGMSWLWLPMSSNFKAKYTNSKLTKLLIRVQKGSQPFDLMRQ